MISHQYKKQPKSLLFATDFNQFMANVKSSSRLLAPEEHSWTYIMLKWTTSSLFSLEAQFMVARTYDASNVNKYHTLICAGWVSKTPSCDC